MAVLRNLVTTLAEARCGKMIVIRSYKRLSAAIEWMMARRTRKRSLAQDCQSWRGLLNGPEEFRVQRSEFFFSNSS